MTVSKFLPRRHASMDFQAKPAPDAGHFGVSHQAQMMAEPEQSPASYLLEEHA